MVLAAYVIHDTSEYHYPFSEFDMSRLYSEEIFKDSSSLLFVPLHCQDRVYGYVVADYSYLNLAAGERLFDFIVHMNMLLLNIENAAKLKKTLNVLNDMYIRDPLTNLLNRRGFYRDVDSVILKAKSVESDIMIVSVDLDGLKYINDTFGHSEGDYAIRAIADVLKEVTADHGICARFGGDEYLAAIVGNTDENDFKARFLKKITELNENSNKQYPIMASIGIVIITAESALTSLQEAIKNADDKMFAHKKKSKYSRESMEK
jgi:diguanylate cyclase (GGDEF)-like protein